ncbi:MAG TPA: hypothetical protein GX396_00010 [Tissierellia bacterium]|nr:hypothetical protein [Tissierellia bacterium]
MIFIYYNCGIFKKCFSIFKLPVDKASLEPKDLSIQKASLSQIINEMFKLEPAGRYEN